jgi:predicted HicB family RNase H-like nuclease
VGIVRYGHGVIIHYEIPDDLHRKAKAAAAIAGVTLKDYIVAALEQRLSTKGQP